MCFSLYFGHRNLGTHHICDWLEVLFKKVPILRKWKLKRTWIFTFEELVLSVNKLKHKMDFMVHIAPSSVSSRPYKKPHLNTKMVFYCRQHWMYNLEIWDGNESYIVLWSEDEATVDNLRKFPAFMLTKTMPNMRKKLDIYICIIQPCKCNTFIACWLEHYSYNIPSTTT
jgi:hypothetical protein